MTKSFRDRANTDREGIEMQSGIKAMGHAIHPMLIVFPLGLLGAATVFDVLNLFLLQGGFSVASQYMIAAGVLGGLLAAVFGLGDWVAIPAGTRAKRLGALHGGGNVIVVVLFALSWLLRLGAPDGRPGVPPLVLEIVALALAGATGWLGGELVERLGVGVDEGAHADAPSSLSGPITGTGRRVRANAR
jgi:uncharacterized membrane protein